MTKHQTHRTWTSQEDARLAELRGQGLSNSHIARDLARTRASVKQRAHVLRARSGAPVTAPCSQTALSTYRNDLERATAEVERAAGNLARAKAQQREVMEVILPPVRKALDEVGIVVLPDPKGNGDGPEQEAAWRLVDSLRKRGVELRKMA